MAFQLRKAGAAGAGSPVSSVPGYWRVHVGMHILSDDVYVSGRLSRPERVPEELVGGLVTRELTILRVERRQRPREGAGDAVAAAPGDDDAGSGPREERAGSTTGNAEGA